MAYVTINAITVDPERADELAQRFAARAGQVDNQAGFEEFQLLRPTDQRNTWLVYTRWRDKESFEAWVNSPAFMQGHARPQGSTTPVATHSELWTFDVEQRTGAPASQTA